jgi:hypothetical protein
VYVFAAVLAASFALSSERAHAAVEVQLSPSSSSPQPVGSTVVWTAAATDTNPGTFDYRFSVRPPGGVYAVVRDFAPSNSFEWTPSEREGTFDVRVAARNASTGEVSQLMASYSVGSRLTGSGPVISTTANPLVALYSAPACEAGSMRVRFWRAGDFSSQTTPWKSCLPGVSMNFYVAGMLSASEYSIRHEVSADPAAPVTAGPTLSFLTGTLPAGFAPASTVLTPPAGDSGQDVVLLSYLNRSTSPSVGATDLSGALIWYYDRKVQYATRPVEGGTVLAILDSAVKLDTLREIDLAGNTVRETNIKAVSDQVVALGGQPVTSFHHEARRLPDGRTLVLAGTERVMSDVQGPGPVAIVGDMIILLDKDWQVVWSWDSFDHLDVTRKALLNQKCPQLCFTTSPTANDWTHSNSIGYSPADGNLLLSIRHQDWVVKIDFRDGLGTGAVLWKLGKDGDFTYDSADPYPWFSHQHDADFVLGDTATLSLYDNGNMRQSAPDAATRNSRGQVLNIDEAGRKVTFRLNADLGGYSSALGSAQTLAGGNFHFLSGFLPDSTTRSIESRTDGTPAFVLRTQGLTYRSFRMRSLYTLGAAGGEDQTISFDAIAAQTYQANGATLDLGATASSGLPVGLRVVSGPATLSGNTLTLTGAGTVVVQADQDGNIRYNPARSVRQTFAVNKANQTITFGALADRTFGDADFAPTAAASSNLPVSFAAAGPCTFAGGVIHFTGAGLCTVTASQAGDANFNPAAPVQRYFAIKKAVSTTVVTVVDAVYDGLRHGGTATVTGTGGLNQSWPVAYEGRNATVYGPSSAAPTDAGDYRAFAGYGGDPNHTGSSDSKNFQIAKAGQTITFGVLPDKTFGAPDFALSATASSGLAVSFGLSAGGQCALSGNTVHINGAGSCTITASQSGNANFAAATSVPRTFTVNKAVSTTTVSVANATYDGQPHGGSAVVTGFGGLNQGQAVTYAGRNGTVYGPSTTAPADAGDYTASANFPGDSDHTGSNDSRNFQIAKANQTITFGALPARTFGDPDFAVSATASSGLAVILSAAGNCTVNGSTVHINGAGSCTVTASQPGDGNRNAATAVTRPFTIAKATQTINITTHAPASAAYDSHFTVAAAGGGSGNPVTYKGTGACSNDGAAFTMTSGTGACTVAYTQAGNADYEAAQTAETVTAGKAAQTITFVRPGDKTYGDADFGVSASASSGLAPSFAAEGACTVVASNVHITGAGSCTVTASQAGDGNYGAAPAVARSFSISKAATATSLSSSSNPSGAGQGLTFTAAVTSAAGTPAGQVQFRVNGASVGGPVTLNSGGVASLTTSALAAGSYTVTADYGGGPNFDASSGALGGAQVVGGLFEFSLPLYTVAERAGSITVSVRRTGDTGGAAGVDYATDDGSIPSVPVPCSSVTGLALGRCDYTGAAGRLNFAAGEVEKTFVVLVNDDSFTEGTETTHLRLSNASAGAALGSSPSATLELTDDQPESAGNPSDDDETFVRQHYHDFLGREPDAEGLRFWADGIRSCGPDAACREVKRVHTSAAFFLSIEFQQTGFFAYRMHKAASGDLPGRPVPVSFEDFTGDTQALGLEVVVGRTGWEQKLEANKAAYALEFVRRPEFAERYPTLLSAAAFVDMLNANGGGVLTVAERSALISELSPNPADASLRASVLRKVAEHAQFADAVSERAFVLMQYFGYLRRNPDDAPDSDFAGYNFWLGKLNQFDGDFIKAEMVKAFINSDEYRKRFGQ